MASKICIILQLLTCCLIINVSVALIGKHVRSANISSYPFVVSIAQRSRDNRPQHICTGVLISFKAVLTAAHCLLNRETLEELTNVEIIASTSDLINGKIFQPHSWITYDEWKYGVKNSQSLDDIAIIQLAGEGTRHENISRASFIPTSSIYLCGANVTTLGWGKTASLNMRPLLKRAKMQVISNRECSSHAARLTGRNTSIPSNYFCTAGNPPVQVTRGDDGGPVVNKLREVVGINVGVFPRLKGHNLEYLKEHLVNTNLNLERYELFIQHFKMRFSLNTGNLRHSQEAHCRLF